MVGCPFGGLTSAGSTANGGNGSGIGSGGSAEGGAIFALGGNVTVDSSTFVGDQASGGIGGLSTGGAIFASNLGASPLSLHVSLSTFTRDSARSTAANQPGENGGDAQGGAIAVVGGLTTIDGGNFSANTAIGGTGATGDATNRVGVTAATP